MNSTISHIDAKCPRGHAFKVKSKAEGRTLRCPKCESPTLISRPTAGFSDVDVFPDSSPDANGFSYPTLDSDLPEDNQSPPWEVQQFLETPQLAVTSGTTSAQQSTATPHKPPVSTTPVDQKTFKRFALSVELLLIALLAAQVFGFARTKTSTTSWEYRIESPSDTRLEASVDGLGKDGWELVFARRATSEYGGASYEMIFKRPR